MKKVTKRPSRNPVRKQSREPLFSRIRKPSRLLKLIFFTAGLVVCIVYLPGVIRQTTEKARNSLYNSSWGICQTIEVIGNERLSPQEILNAAQINLGVLLNEIPLDSVVDRIEKISTVKKARTLKRIPNKLIIHIQERTPLATITQGNLKFVDEEGVVFPIANSKNDHDTKSNDKLNKYIDLPIIVTNASGTHSAQIKRSAALLSLINTHAPALYNELNDIRVIGSDISLRLRTSGAQIRLPKNGSLVSETTISQLSSYSQNTISNSNAELTRTLEVLNEYLLYKTLDFKIPLPDNLKYLDLRFPDIIIAGT